VLHSGRHSVLSHHQHLSRAPHFHCTYHQYAEATPPLLLASSHLFSPPPLATSQVGGIVGFTVMDKGMRGVNWERVGHIMLSTVTSPLLGMRLTPVTAIGPLTSPVPCKCMVFSCNSIACPVRGDPAVHFAKRALSKARVPGTPFFLWAHCRLFVLLLHLPLFIWSWSLCSHSALLFFLSRPIFSRSFVSRLAYTIIAYHQLKRVRGHRLDHVLPSLAAGCAPFVAVDR